MSPAGASTVTGLILAGGRGERIGGGDKGWIDYQGKPLIVRAVERLTPQVASILISANRNLDRYSVLAPIVTDIDAGLQLESFAGPLVGVLSGLRRASSSYVAVVACDAPHFPLNLVQRLLLAIQEAAAAYARTNGMMQPTFALVRSSAADSLAQSLLSGERALHRWLTSLNAVPVDFDDEHAFDSINTLADIDKRVS
jgi:molybdenum cofactor guanylyltransferase